MSVLPYDYLSMTREELIAQLSKYHAFVEETSVNAARAQEQLAVVAEMMQNQADEIHKLRARCETLSDMLEEARENLNAEAEQNAYLQQVIFDLESNCDC